MLLATVVLGTAVTIFLVRRHKVKQLQAMVKDSPQRHSPQKPVGRAEERGGYASAEVDIPTTFNLAYNLVDRSESAYIVDQLVYENPSPTASREPTDDRDYDMVENGLYEQPYTEIVPDSVDERYVINQLVYSEPQPQASSADNFIYDELI